MKAGLALLVTVCAAAQTPPAQPVKAALCDILKQPDSYNGKVVQFRATVDSGIQNLPSGASDETCAAELPFYSPDDAHLAQLMKSKEFRKLTKGLQKTPLVQATITGLFAYTSAGGPKLGLAAVEDVVVAKNKAERK